MTAFPRLPRQLVHEIFVNGGWMDISADVYHRDTVTITRGRTGESGNIPPSSLGATLRNIIGHYSAGNPEGPYFESFGLNSPYRCGLVLTEDLFDRTVVNGWGATGNDQTYSLTGLGGTILASDFGVDGNNHIAFMYVPVASAFRMAYLPSVRYRNVDVAVTCSIPLNDIAGGSIEPINILLRGQTVNDYYMIRVAITTSETITVAIRHADDSIIASAVTVSGLTQNAALVFRVRAQAEGQTLRAKVWNVSTSEPYDWHVTGNSTRILSAGWVGLRSGVASGNTNIPVLFNYLDLTVRSPRFAGGLTDLPENWDLSGNDQYVTFQSEGSLRRLGQGSSPLRSAMYRAFRRESTAIAYWPMEDPEGSQMFASGITGGSPMTVSPGPENVLPSFASSSVFASSAPLPTPDTTTWNGTIPPYTSSTTLQIFFLLYFPPGGAGELDNRTLFNLQVAGTAPSWHFHYDSSGSGTVNIRASEAQGVLLDGPGIGAVHGRKKFVLLRLEQIGSDVRVTAGGKNQDADPAASWTQSSMTLAGRTFVRGLRITINPQQLITSAVSVGHVIVFRTSRELSDWNESFNAYLGETAGRRIERLCAAESVPFSYRGDLDRTARMGYQRQASFLSLLEECAEADLGTLHESRGHAGLAYRTRESLYNQNPVVTLDYSAAQISPPFSPIRDDRSVRNDVTVNRTGGSSYQSVQTTGPFAVTESQLGGIGRYDTSVTLNVADDYQLPDLAGWLRLLGTVNETRYPKIRIDLATRGFTQNAELAAACLDLDIDDYLEIINVRRLHTPNAINQLMRGFVETINDMEHSLVINCAPESPYEVAELDAVGHKVDSASSVLTGGPYAANVTTLSVSSASTDLWTTNAAHFPIDLRISGERITATNITGTSSPQTFTVIRSVNGVTKQLLNGAVVRLWRRPVIAL